MAGDRQPGGDGARRRADAGGRGRAGAGEGDDRRAARTLGRALRPQPGGIPRRLPYNLDSWDGYPAARERLYATFRDAGVRPIVLSGDSHAFWANDLADAGGRSVAAEFGTSSITSPSVGDEIPQLPLGRLLEQANDEVVFCDQRAKGYILLTIDRDAARADYVGVSTILAKPYEAATLARFEVRAGTVGERLKRIA